MEAAGVAECVVAPWAACGAEAAEVAEAAEAAGVAEAAEAAVVAECGRERGVEPPVLAPNAASVTSCKAASGTHV